MSGLQLAGGAEQTRPLSGGRLGAEYVAVGGLSSQTASEEEGIDTSLRPPSCIGSTRRSAGELLCHERAAWASAGRARRAGLTFLVAAAATLVLAGVAQLFWNRVSPVLGRRSALKRASGLLLSKWAEPHSGFEKGCSKYAHHVDYGGTSMLYRTPDVDSEGVCRSNCMENPQCGVWAFGKEHNVRGFTKVCFLYAVHDGQALWAIRRFGVISGIRTGVECIPIRNDGNPGGASAWESHGAPRGQKVLLKSRLGPCLTAADPPVGGAELIMAPCSSTAPEQLWSLDELTGLMQGNSGECLTSEKNQIDFSTMLMKTCKERKWNQQWGYDKLSILKNWHGVCLAVGEARDGGMVYTRICDVDDKSQLWEPRLPEAVGPAAPQSPEYNAGSLFCFALMLPYSYEQLLLTTQFVGRASLFACEASAIYSNVSIKISEGLYTHVIQSNLTCSKGGEFGTALNNDIFLVVWRKVIAEGTYLDHDWTVKVDPDAVFFPDRLRIILRIHPESVNGTYLNNCKYGMHGPLEVLSRNAVSRWGVGIQTCLDHFQQICGGDCRWGEDMFIDQCLSKVLAVDRQNDFRLLVEDHCQPPPGWESCTDVSKVSFHPFKTVEGYGDCLRSGGWVPPPSLVMPTAAQTPAPAPYDATYSQTAAAVPAPGAPSTQAQALTQAVVSDAQSSWGTTLMPATQASALSAGSSSAPAPFYATPQASAQAPTYAPVPAYSPTPVPAYSPTPVQAPAQAPALAPTPVQAPAQAPALAPTPVPAPAETPAPTEAPTEEPCQDVNADSRCWEAVMWAKSDGIFQHPEWYPKSLTSQSSTEDFQAYLHSDHPDVHCPRPCPKGDA